MQTQPFYTAKEIASALGISERAVHLKGLPCSKQATRGGYQHVFLADLLPTDLKQQLMPLETQHLKPSGDSAQAGFVRGNKLTRETALAADSKRIAREQGLAQFMGLSEARRKEAEAKFEILKARDAFISATELPVKRGSELFCREVRNKAIDLPKWIIQAAAQRNGNISLSWPTLCRWKKAYEASGLFGLSGKYTRTRETSIPEHMQQFIIAMKYEFPDTDLPKIRAGLEARFDGQEIPHRASLRRFVKKWEKENKGLMEYRADPDKWKNKNMFAFGDASEGITRLNQLWEMDSTPGDVMLTDGRHTLIGVIDVFSRRVKLLVTPTSNSISIAALIRRGILDWGVPETIRMDNGKDYMSNLIIRVLDDLEIMPDICDPFSPEQKPFVERALGTFSHDIVELLPGYIGHSVADRKSIEARRSFAQRLMRQGGDPVEVKMTSEELQDICDRWVHAVYHQNPHSGLDGQTPTAMARDWPTPILRVENERALDMLLCPAPRDGGYRTITKKGVGVEGIPYISTEMSGHEGQRVRVLLDATDLGTVYVYTEDRKYLCAAINPDYKDISRAEYANLVKKRQKEVLNEGRRELKKIAKEQAVSEIHMEILEHRERKIDHIKDFPKQSETYTTPALDEAARAVNDMDRKARGPRPIEISPEQEFAAQEVIELAERKKARPLPGNDWERYEMLEEDLRAGVDVLDADLAWMKRYELYLLEGEQIANLT